MFKTILATFMTLTSMGKTNYLNYVNQVNETKREVAYDFVETIQKYVATTNVERIDCINDDWYVMVKYPYFEDEAGCDITFSYNTDEMKEMMKNIKVLLESNNKTNFK